MTIFSLKQIRAAAWFVWMTLGLSTMGHSQEPQLVSEKFQSPALKGYLGNPQLGLPRDILSDGVLWHRNGNIFARVGYRGSSRLCVWSEDPSTHQVILKASVPCYGAWSVSNRGDLICIQSRRGQEEPGIDKLSTWDPGSLGCYRLEAGSTRLWKLPVRRDDMIVGVVFTSDDSKVAVLMIQSQQMTLRLLDSKTGVELKRYDFEMPEQREFRETNLIARGDEILMSRYQSGERIFLRFPLQTFKPEPMDVPPADVRSGMASSMRDDGRTMAFFNQNVCQLFQKHGSKWEQIFEAYNRTADPIYTTPEDIIDVVFKPGGESFILNQRAETKVVDLSKFETRAKMNRCFSYVTFSHDGLRVLGIGHGGFEMLSAQTLQPLTQTKSRGHQMPPRWLRFLPDGLTLASAAAEGIWLWDVESQRPRAFLQATRSYCPEDALNSVAVSQDGKVLIGEESDHFAFWRLPPLFGPPPEEPLLIKAQPAFTSVSEPSLSDTFLSVFSNHSGSTLVTQNRGLVVRDGLDAKTSQRWDKIGPTFRIETGMVDEEGHYFTYIEPMQRKWSRVDLRTGESVKLLENLQVPGRSNAPQSANQRERVEQVAILPRKNLFLAHGIDSFCLLDSTDGSLKRWLDRLPQDYRYSPTFETVVSEDENKLVAQVENSNSSESYLAVWDLSSGQLQSLSALPNNDCQSLALSRDGSTIACGHRSGAISLWAVALLPKFELPTSAAPKVLQPPTQVKPQPQTPMAVKPGAPSQSAQTVTYSKERMVRSLDSRSWGFQEDGYVTKAPTFPESGRLRIKGQAFKNEGWKLAWNNDLTKLLNQQVLFDKRPEPGEPPLPPDQILRDFSFALVAAGVISQAEGKVGNVWVSRQTGVPPTSSGFLTFVETLTNTGSSAEPTTVQFEVQFPASTGRLIDRGFKALDIAPDGEVKLSPDSTWIAPILQKDDRNPIPVLEFRSESSATMPKVIWKAAENRLVVQHSVLLNPAEARYLVHRIGLIYRQPDTAPDIFREPNLRDFASWVPLDVRMRGINFGSSYPHDIEQARDFLGRDSSGFEWGLQREASFKGELGASGVLQLWIDDSPLPFASCSIYDCMTNLALRSGQPYHFQRHYGESLDHHLQVQRWLYSIGRRENCQISDHIRNRHTEPVTTTLSLVNSFDKLVKSIRSDSGRQLALTGQVDVTDEDVAVVVECEGELMPSTFLAFCDKDAPLKPRIRWLSPQVLRLDYQVTIPPGERLILWHGTTQRPVAAFASFNDAFSNTLPFKRVQNGIPTKGQFNMK